MASTTLTAPTVLGGLLGLATGGLLGVALGRSMSKGHDDSPMPEALGIFGAIGGAVLFSALGNQFNQQSLTISRTTSNSNVEPDNTQNANGLPNLPPPGA